MIKIISFDVGIKNMAYCILEKTTDKITIIDWDIIDMFSDQQFKICSGYLKNKCCNQKAKFYNTDRYICHKKTCEKYMKNLYPDVKFKKLKQITVKDTPLITIAEKLLNKLLDKPELLNVDEVVIENQPCLLNPTMKSIQMILYTYFLQNGYISSNSTINNIHLFSARKKLKYYNGPEIDVSHIKNKYSQRKFLSIEYTKYLIKDQPKWLAFFIEHKKKDDLADAYIQGCTYLYK